MSEKGSAFIRRKRKEEKFTRLSNDLLRNEGLSWKARGLLSYMLSMPDDWVFYETELVKHSKKDGITSLRSAMKELKEFGYVVKEPQRDELGKITNWVTYVDEEPMNNPDYGKPTIWETQNVDNQTLLTTDVLQTNNSTNKDYGQNEFDRLIEQQFDEFWKVYYNRKKKQESLKSFVKAIKKHGIEKVMNGTYEYIKVQQYNGTDKQFLPHPTTFLNQAVYLDDMSEYVKNKNVHKNTLFNPWEVQDGRESNQTNLFDNSGSIPTTVKQIGFGDVL